MDQHSITKLIRRISIRDSRAASDLWQQVGERLREFALLNLDERTARSYDENDAANSAFHTVCRGLAEGRLDVENRDALWALLAVITSRKISAQRRYSGSQKRGGGDVRGDSGFGTAGINQVEGNQMTPDLLVEVSESCSQMLDAVSDETMRRVLLLKFNGATNREVAGKLGCTQRTIERKLERIRRIWIEAGLHPRQ